MRKALCFVSRMFLALLFVALPAFAGSQPVPAKEKLVFFFSQSCYNCHAVKEGVLAAIGRDHADRVEIEYRDIADIENYKLLLGIRTKVNLTSPIEVPSVYYAGQLLVGKDRVNRVLPRLVQQAGIAAAASPDQMPAIDLVKDFFAFTPIAVVGAGLIDGINPCAFTVIVFFISFLALQGYSRRELILIGSSFIAAVFLTYLLLGLGLFSFFYSLKGWLIVRKLLNFGIGSFTLFLGMLAIRDIMIFKKTGSTEGMALQLPAAVKDQIHKVIGLAYRTGSAANAPSRARPVAAVVSTALVTGFLVSLLEAVCTGQVYLPTITFVLKTTPVKLQAAGYLALYNAMFIVPLVVIFLCALAGVTSGEFAKFLHRHFSLTKALLACMFFVFGIFLIWRG
jgi:hypothetical protein